MCRRGNDEGHIACHEGCADQFREGVEEERVVFVELDGVGVAVRFRRQMWHGDGGIASEATTRTNVQTPRTTQDSKYSSVRRVNRKRYKGLTRMCDADFT